MLQRSSLGFFFASVLLPESLGSSPGIIATCRRSGGVPLITPRVFSSDSEASLSEYFEKEKRI